MKIKQGHDSNSGVWFTGSRSFIDADASSGLVSKVALVMDKLYTVYVYILQIHTYNTLNVNNSHLIMYIELNIFPKMK